MAAVKTSCRMLKVSALSGSAASFTVTMLASVSSGSNLDRKQVLFFLTMQKTRSSSALEWGIVKINLTTFQRRGKRRVFSAYFFGASFICPKKLQSESNFLVTSVGLAWFYNMIWNITITEQLIFVKFFRQRVEFRRFFER